MSHLEEAQNVNTSPSRLEQLGRDGDEITKRAVASNPNTPLDCLLWLARVGFAGEVSNNPVLEWEFVVDAGFLSRAPRHTPIRLAEAPRAPRWLREALLLHPSLEVRAEVLANPWCPLELLHRAFRREDADLELFVAVLAHPSLLPEAASRIHCFGSQRVRRAVGGGHPGYAPIVGEGLPAILRAPFFAPYPDHQGIAQLADHPDPVVAVMAYLNPYPYPSSIPRSRRAISGALRGVELARTSA